MREREKESESEREREIVQTFFHLFEFQFERPTLKIL